VVVLDFFRDGQHLDIDAMVTTVYRNTVLHKVSTVPGYAAKQAEDMKFYVDRTSADPIASIHGGPHVLVPFALEDGGRLGGHAHALLRSFATLVVEKVRPSPPPEPIETPHPPRSPPLLPCGSRDSKSVYPPGCTLLFQSKSCASCAPMPLLASHISRLSRYAIVV
jgi:hypothetical protein